jgi:hypothetical protein
MKMTNLNNLVLYFLAPLLLAACSSAAPQLIASYPSDEQPILIGKHPAPPEPAVYVQDAYLEMEVSNVERASERAEEAANQYGGYLVSAQTWRQDGKQIAALTLAVPAAQFEGALRELKNLGSVKSERISGEWVEAGPGDNTWTVYSQINLSLYPRTVAWPSLPRTGWDPAHTFRSALQVCVTVFGFLVDILIWLVVVVGPFVLIGWGGLTLYRRAQKRSQQP